MHSIKDPALTLLRATILTCTTLFLTGIALGAVAVVIEGVGK
jgi:hypothetical protein